jgi:type I restriction enzyme R subunit
MVKELLENLRANKPTLAPNYVWEAYRQLEETNPQSPKSELIALVSLLRRLTGLDTKLTGYDVTIDRNFQKWIFDKHKGAGQKFTEEQMEWLRMIKEHIATSFHIEVDDLDYTPFDSKGGRGKMWQLFGAEMDTLIDELNEALAA